MAGEKDVASASTNVSVCLKFESGLKTSFVSVAAIGDRSLDCSPVAIFSMQKRKSWLLLTFP